MWEQYDATNGEGRRSHPFTGWTSLVTLSAFSTVAIRRLTYFFTDKLLLVESYVGKVLMNFTSDVIRVATLLTTPPNYAVSCDRLKRLSSIPGLDLTF